MNCSQKKCKTHKNCLLPKYIYIINTKQNIANIHLEILLTNTNLTLEIVLLMFFCTSHIAPKKKKKKTTHMQQNTRYKIELWWPLILVVTWVWFVIILVCLGQSLILPLMFCFNKTKTRLKPWILSTLHINFNMCSNVISNF